MSWLDDILCEAPKEVRDGIPSFLGEQPTPSEGFDYARHYTEDAEQFDYFGEKSDRLTVTHLRLLRSSAMRMVPKDTALLLDVGCGSAFVAGHFCPRGPQGTRQVSV